MVGTYLEMLGACGVSLGRRLKESDGKDFSKLIIQQIVTSEDYDQQEALAQIAATIGTEIAPDQAPELLSALLGKLFNQRYGGVSERSKAAIALIPLLQSADAESALKTVEGFIVMPGRRRGEEIHQTIVQIAGAVALRLTPVQAKAALSRALDRQWHMRVSKSEMRWGRLPRSFRHGSPQIFGISHWLWRDGNCPQAVRMRNLQRGP
jgi:hypothetical protein